jgi:AraC family transcriptional regulator
MNGFPAAPAARDHRAWLAARLSEDSPRRSVQVWPDGALSVTRDLVDAPHRGFHASIKIGLTSDFETRCGADGSVERVSAVMIAPSVLHSSDGRGSLIAALLIDPECSEFSRITHWFQGSPGSCVLPNDIAEALRRLVLEKLGAGEPFIAIWEAVLARLSGQSTTERHCDPRVLKTAAFLKENFVTPPRVSELAERVDLSVSRLVHLFTRDMGVSLRTYVHWLRMRDVMYAIACGESLTLAAHRAGFADLAHLTRKFRDMFGEPPSRLGARGSLSFVHRPQNSVHSITDSARIGDMLKLQSQKTALVHRG